MNINMYMPVRVFSGKGCLDKHFNEVLRFGTKCLIVTGKNSAKISGAFDDTVRLLNKFGIVYKVFDAVTQNPTTKCCKTAGDMAKEINADFVFGIGGGSVLDAAKAIAIFAANPDMKHDEIYNRSIPSSHLPVILVGTSAGTGSEVTGVSVLTNSITGMKKSISGADCYADVAFCDYSYTESTNIKTRISTALDAFSHALESYLGNVNNDIVALYALKSIELSAPYVLHSDFTSLSDNDFETLYVSSIYAGLAINIAGTCYPHTVGYYLTESFNIPHGMSCAMLLTGFLKRAKKYCPDKVEAMLKVANCSFDDLINSINKLIDVDIAFSESDAEKVGERWKNGVKNFDRTPGGFDYKLAISALKELFVK